MSITLRAWPTAMAAIFVGLVTWMLVATIANVGLRRILPGYPDVEAVMDFTLPMLVGRLIIGALASAATGVVIAWITPRRRAVVVSAAVLLFAFFVPMHYTLWDRFPIWYHAVFLVGLLVLPPLAFAVLVRASPPARRPPTPAT